MPESRELHIARAFVELADTLVSDFDVAELMHSLIDHVVDLLGAAAAGLMLSDQRGNLQVLASSTERARMIELFQLQSNEGPCLECFRTGEPVVVPDLSREMSRWPRFIPVAQQEGFSAVHATPLRLRDDVIGAMNVFGTQPGALPDDDLRLAQALTDVATIGILQERALQTSDALVEQLQGALNSRIVIEQAKGILAERGNVDMEEAFSRLRQHARRTNSLLSALSRDLVEGRMNPNVILGSSPGVSAPPRQRPRPS